MADSLLQQANKAALESVKPSQFTVGGTFDGHRAEGGVTYNRSWKNGWGATAYAKAWWNDSAVLPQDKTGAVVGGEIVKKFLFVLMLLSAAPAFAQNPPVLATWRFGWIMPSNIPSITVAQTFEPRFFDNGQAMGLTTGMTCAAATLPEVGIFCSVPVGSANATTLNTLGGHSVTVALFRADLGVGVQSLPLARPTPAGAATGLRLIPQD